MQLPASMPAADESWIAILARHKTYAALFVAAAVATFAATPFYIRLAQSRGWLDRPGGRKLHERPTATMGGLVLFAPVYCGVAAALALGNRVSAMLGEHVAYIAGALICTAAAMAVGVFDDLRGVRVKIKFAVQLAIAVAAYFVGFRIEAVTLPWAGSTQLGGVSFLLTVAWVVTIINAVNFTDGLDGLAAGVCFLAASVNAGVAIWLGNYYMAVMMLLLAGALLGFLRWNFYPARVFLGDTGSLGLGTFLALCSLHSAQKSHTVVMILVPLCALGYPIFDMLVAMARRTVRGQPLWSSDREHIHHRLLARGQSPSRAALTIYVSSLIVAVACLIAMTANHFVVGLSVAVILLLAVFSVRVLGYLEWGGWRMRTHTKILHAAANLARLKMQGADDMDAVLDALSIFAREAGLTRLTIATDDGRYTWTHPRAVAAVESDLVASHGLAAKSSHAEIRSVEFTPVEVMNDPERRALLDELLRIHAARLSNGARFIEASAS